MNEEWKTGWVENKCGVKNGKNGNGKNGNVSEVKLLGDDWSCCGG